MGKIAVRLARRHDPLYEKAKNIVRAASNYVSDSDDIHWASLAARLEAELNALPTSEFKRLIDMALDAAEPRQDGDEVVDIISDTLTHLCQGVDEEDSDAVGYLVALPVVVEGRAWNTEISATQADRVAQVLKELSLVESNAKVFVYPRLIGALEGEILSPADVYRLTRLLEKRQAVLGEQLFDQARNAAGLERDAASTQQPVPGLVSAGLLVAYVASDDLEPFPMAMELDHALELSTDDAGEDLPGTDAAVEEAFEDVREALVGVAESLSKVLSTTFTAVLDPVRSWFSGVAEARRFERVAKARSWLDGTAKEYAAGNVGALCFGDMRLAPDTGFEMDIHLKSGGKFLSSHRWEPLGSIPAEGHDDCLEHMKGFLQSTGLTSLADSATKSSSATSGHRSLH